MNPINATDIRRLREQAEHEGRIVKEHESRLASLKTDYDRAHFDVERRARDLEKKGAEIKQLETEITRLRAVANKDEHELAEMQNELARTELQRRRPPPGRGMKTPY